MVELLLLMFVIVKSFAGKYVEKSKMNERVNS